MGLFQITPMQIWRKTFDVTGGERKTWMLKDKRICITVSERDFAQGLNFSRIQRNTFIDAEIVVEINDAKNGGKLIKTFFGSFAKMLKLAIITKLSFDAYVFDIKDFE